MMSDDALQKDQVTTEAENQETASSPESDQPSAEANGTQQEPAATEPAPLPNPTEPEPIHDTPDEVPQGSEPPQVPPTEPPLQVPATEPPPEVPANPPAEPVPAPAQPVPTPAEASTETTESRPRPQLNPTVDPHAAKPVPTYDAVQSPASAQTPVGSDKEPQAPPPEPKPVYFAPPSEIPKAADLDSDLEAQIAAAQATDAAAGSQPAPKPEAPAEGEAGKPVEAAPTSEEELEPGHKLRGKVQSIAGDDVFFDVGFRSPALVSLRQFDAEKQPQIGQEYTIIVDKANPAEGLIHANLPRGRRKIQGNWDAVAAGQVVDCMVTKTNKGGLEITVSNLRGFLPASQVDMHYVSDLEKYVGEKLTVKITEANRAKRNLIVSRRAYLQETREAQAQDVWAALEVGQAKKGTVKTLKDYGAFVDIGGVDGFLHIGEISWNRIRHPSDVLTEGQEIDVQILTLDPDKKRIGLGMRQLAQNPWDTATQKYAQGTSVSGRVTRTTDFGAFVELEPGVEGLVHISELEYRRVNKVTDVLNVGDQTDFQVLDVDLGRKRISLSLKALKEKPPEFDKKPEKPADEDLAPGAGENYTRKRKGPLKGGTGGSAGGGLFGNPGDFS